VKKCASYFEAIRLANKGDSHGGSKLTPGVGLLVNDPSSNGNNGQLVLAERRELRAENEEEKGESHV
jgi:hypothetical protein